MKVRMKTQLTNGVRSILGWAIGEATIEPTININTVSNRGFLIISTVIGSSANLFGQPFDDIAGHAKKLYIDQTINRGDGLMAGTISANASDGSLVQLTTSEVYNESKWTLEIKPNFDSSRYLKIEATAFPTGEAADIQVTSTGVISHTFTPRTTYGNTPIKFSEIMGEVLFDDVRLFIDSTNVIATTYLEGEYSWVEVDIIDLPMTTREFVKDFDKCIIDNGVVVINAPLTGRTIAPDDIDITDEESLRRANTVQIFGSL